MVKGDPRYELVRPPLFWERWENYLVHADPLEVISAILSLPEAEAPRSKIVGAVSNVVSTRIEATVYGQRWHLIGHWPTADTYYVYELKPMGDELPRSEA